MGVWPKSYLNVHRWTTEEVKAPKECQLEEFPKWDRGHVCFWAELDMLLNKECQTTFTWHRGSVFTFIDITSSNSKISNRSWQVTVQNFESIHICPIGGIRYVGLVISKSCTNTILAVGPLWVAATSRPLTDEVASCSTGFLTFNTLMSMRLLACWLMESRVRLASSASSISRLEIRRLGGKTIYHSVKQCWNKKKTDSWIDNELTVYSCFCFLPSGSRLMTIAWKHWRRKSATIYGLAWAATRNKNSYRKTLTPVIW